MNSCYCYVNLGKKYYKEMQEGVIFVIILFLIISIMTKSSCNILCYVSIHDCSNILNNDNNNHDIDNDNNSDK